MTIEQWTSPHGTPLPRIGERTLIMGILNVTPDSFSDGGAWTQVSQAIERVRQLLHEGADVIDIGGESTRPDAVPISAADEIARTIPVIRALRNEFPEVPLSIDTYKADVAAAAIEAGADMINDVWGLKYGISESDPRSPMAAVAAEKKCPVFLMHNRQNRDYTDFWAEIIADLEASVVLAHAAGIANRQIWLDPGFGFGKNPPHNLEVLKNVDRIRALGFPVLLGTSRKSTIGLVLNREVNERVDGTAASVVWGIAKGCEMVRIHDVAEIRPFIQMADAIRQGSSFRSKRS